MRVGLNFMVCGLAFSVQGLQEETHKIQNHFRRDAIRKWAVPHTCERFMALTDE